MSKIKQFLLGFRHAFLGILTGFQELNMKFHGLATVVVLGLAVWLRLSLIEWLMILLLIGLIWAGELINTSLEELSNLVRDELKLSYQATRRVRDTAAGAVLVLAVVAAIIGGVIFLPKLLAIFS